MLKHPYALSPDYRRRLIRGGLLTIAPKRPAPTPEETRERAQRGMRHFAGRLTATAKAAMMPPLCQMGRCMAVCKWYDGTSPGRKRGEAGYGIHCEEHAKLAAERQRLAVAKARGRAARKRGI